MSHAGLISEATVTGNDIKTITGEVGGAVAADLGGNLNLLGTAAQGLSFTGTPGTNTVTGNISDASTIQKGVVELATDAEAAAQSSTTVVLTPSNISSFDTLQYNGFIDPLTDVQITFTNGTRTLKVDSVGASYTFWSNGKKYSVTGFEEIIIDNTEGIHVVYYDGATLSKTMVFSDDLILQYAIVAIIYWDATNAKQLYLGDEYLHSVSMSPGTHLYLHQTRGYALESGGGLTDILADQSGALNTHAQFGVERTEAWDEDAYFDLALRTSISTIPVYYKSGADASDIWRINEAATFGVLTTGTGRAAYNRLNAGTWSQQEVTNGRYVLAHVFVYNDSTRRFGVIQGIAEYSSISNARDAAVSEITAITLDGLPGAEFKFIGTLIYQTSDTYGNTVKSRIRTTDGGDDYIDLRGENITRGGISGTISDHGSLTGLSNDDHIQYLLADGTRTLTGTFTHDGIAAGYADSENVSKQAGVQTADAVATQIAAITLAANTMVTVQARFNGFKSDYSESCGGFVRYTARRAGAGAIEVAAPLVDVQTDSAGAPTVDADVSGNDVRLLVTGVAASTFNWTVTYQYNFTKTSA